METGTVKPGFSLSELLALKVGDRVQTSLDGVITVTVEANPEDLEPVIFGKMENPPFTASLFFKFELTRKCETETTAKTE